MSGLAVLPELESVVLQDSVQLNSVISSVE